MRTLIIVGLSLMLCHTLNAQKRVVRKMHEVIKPDTAIYTGPLNTRSNITKRNDTLFYYEISTLDVTLYSIPIGCIDWEYLKLQYITGENVEGDEWEYYQTVVSIDDYSNKKCKCWRYEYEEMETMADYYEDMRTFKHGDVSDDEPQKDNTKRKYQLTKTKEYMVFIQSETRVIFDWLRSRMPAKKNEFEN